MIRTHNFIFFLIISPCYCFGQYYFYSDRYYATDLVWEIGISAGIMNCLTDVGGINSKGIYALKDLNWQSSKSCYSFSLRGNYKEMITARLDLGIGNVRAADSLLPKEEYLSRGRFQRNLSFETSIIESQLVFETYPLNALKGSTSPIAPYLFVGIGIFHFNPKTKLEGHWYLLKPLRLEGQGFDEYPERKSYKLIQMQVPLGGGVKVGISDRLYLQIEMQHHLLFTDYLDDVSTTYIDPLLFAKYLLPGQADIARKLYNRMTERNPGLVVTPGVERGNKRDGDAYFSFQLRINWCFRPRYRH